MRPRIAPRATQFDGQVLKRWTQFDGDNGTGRCIAIGDGVSQRAWTLVVGSRIYADAKAQTPRRRRQGADAKAQKLVRVQVDPRRNQLIAITPAGAPARW